jgi:fatty-acid desaturase
MLLNSIGMGFNIAVPVIFLASFLSWDDRKQFMGLLLLCYTSAVVTGRTTIYCILVVPTFMSSLVLSKSSLGDDNSRAMKILLLLSLSVALAICKVNIGMSVCLHRYAAHAAFKCGPTTQLFLAVLGCCANQGGPIWWASQHVGHHKYCDLLGDPHSPLMSGTERAFGFFRIHGQVWEEFAPMHLETFAMRVIDTWSFVFVALEFFVCHHFLGRPGLFVSYTSAWLCQTTTLWFNITNHPVPPVPTSSNDKGSNTSKSFYAKCNAANTDGPQVNPWKDPCLIGGGVYLPFVLLDALAPLVGLFVQELEHEHHHEHPRLARRSPKDLAYWGFVYPLEKMGLVWNVVVPDGEDKGS